MGGIATTGGTGWAPGPRLQRVILGLVRAAGFVAIYLVLVLCVWTVGWWRYFLHGERQSWFHVLMVDHAFATSAVIAACAMTVLAGQAAHAWGRAFLARSRGMPADAAAPPPAVPDDLGTLMLAAREAACGPRPDLSRARALLERAVEAGGAEAALALAGWRARGVAGDADPAEARRLYALAAEAGIPGGIHGLAMADELGWGGRADPASAYRGYLRAALLGHAPAAREVARCLGEGIGTARDAVGASEWREAASRGPGPAPGPWPWDAPA